MRIFQIITDTAHNMELSSLRIFWEEINTLTGERTSLSAPTKRRGKPQVIQSCDLLLGW